MSTLDTLLEALDRREPLLAEDLRRIRAEAPTVDDFATVPSRSGALTLSFRNRFLHSSVDPIREANRFANAPENDGSGMDVVFCFGLGLGYHIEAVRRLQPDVTIVAIVLDPAELELVASIRDDQWWRLYGPHRVVHCTDLSAIRTLMEDYRTRTPLLLGLTGFRAVFTEQWHHVQEAFRIRRDRERVNRNTLRRFGKRWVRNTIHNLARHGVIPGIDGLAGSARGLKALVFGAGPTLDEVAPVLADITDTVLVVAVDTAIPALARYGIAADIAVIADPQYWNSRHVDQVDPGEAVLVAEPATYPRIFRLWHGRRLVSASLFPLGAYVDHKLGRKQRLGAGGSVATSAWDLARLLGANVIGLAGIDLGFPHLRTHCAGSFFEQRLIAQGTRLRPAEHGMARYLHGGIPSPVERAGGGTVLSDQRMSVYRSWFAEQIQQHRDVQTVLLSSESSAIPGVPVVSAAGFREDCAGEPSGSAIKHAFLGILRARSEPFLSDSDEAGSILLELSRSFSRLEERAARGQAFCTEHRGSSDVSLLHNLDRIDRELLTAGEGEMAGFIAAEAIMAAAEKTATSIDQSLAQAAEIYTAIVESCRFHRSIIDRTLHR